jgi:hypothetical protein
MERSNMGIRRPTPTKRAGPAGRAKTVGIIERWKQQLAVGEDWPGPVTFRATMKVMADPRRTVEVARDVHGLSDLGVLIGLVILGLVCVGGYFLLMKLVEISRQEDCLLGGGRSCARLQLPSNR